MGFADVFAYVYAILSYPSPSLVLSSSGLSLPQHASVLPLCYYSLWHFKRSSLDYLHDVSGSKCALQLDDRNSWVPCSVSLSSSQWWAKVPIPQSSKGQFRVHSGLYERLQVSFLSWLSSATPSLTLTAGWRHYNVCNCNGKSTGHVLFNYGCASDMICTRSREQAPGYQKEYEGKSLEIFHPENARINHTLFFGLGPIVYYEGKPQSQSQLQPWLDIWHTC